MAPISLGPSISKTATIANYCCEAVRSAILATAWFLVGLYCWHYRSVVETDGSVRQIVTDLTKCSLTCYIAVCLCVWRMGVHCRMYCDDTLNTASCVPCTSCTGTLDDVRSRDGRCDDDPVHCLSAMHTPLTVLVCTSSVYKPHLQSHCANLRAAVDTHTHHMRIQTIRTDRATVSIVWHL